MITQRLGDEEQVQWKAVLIVSSSSSKVFMWVTSDAVTAK